MFVVLILALALVIAIATAWTPIFALIIAVPLFVLFLAYVGLSRRADEKEAGRRGASGAPASGEAGPSGGVWGERRA